MSGLEGLKQRAVDGFLARFGDRPQVLVRAPGRVNLIGEHTDYNDGFVFPAAIDRYVVVAASPAPDASKVWSETESEPAVFDAAIEGETSGWRRFPSGCAWILLREGLAASNVNAFVVSDLPTGAGLSSSAAIELAFLNVWNELDVLGLDPVKLALFGQACEHRYIGVQCGVMDQLASALGKEGQAMLIDVASLQVVYKAVPAGMTLVVCDTGTTRELAASAYNQRRSECTSAAQIMGVTTLREAGRDMLDGTKWEGHEVEHMRARHVISENERCVEFAAALESGDLDRIGRLMRASHESLRDDYQVSSRELDWMAEAAWSADGCVGARMTGAGFGGACIAIVETQALGRFLGDAEKGYRDRSGQEPRFLACRAGTGAGPV